MTRCWKTDERWRIAGKRKATGDQKIPDPLKANEKRTEWGILFFWSQNKERISVSYAVFMLASINPLLTVTR